MAKLNWTRDLSIENLGVPIPCPSKSYEVLVKSGDRTVRTHYCCIEPGYANTYYAMEYYTVEELRVTGKATPEEAMTELEKLIEAREEAKALAEWEKFKTTPLSEDF